MRWELSPEQEMFRDSFREWLAAYAATATVRQWLSDDDVGPFEARLAAEGWLGAGFSEEAGGQGGGLLELALAAEQLGYAAAPGGSWLASVLAIPALAGQPDVCAGVLERGDFVGLTASGRAQDEALTLAGELSRLSRPAQQAVIRTVDASQQTSLADGLAYEADQVNRLFEAGEAKEGTTAFLEKRRPNFA